MIKTFGAFPESTARKYARETLDGLSYLHSQGVIHRDIKGANVLISADGVAKLADFGASQFLDSPDATKSIETTLAGTPYFMVSILLLSSLPLFTLASSPLKPSSRKEWVVARMCGRSEV